ncbi:S-layer homology domain-containing protein [Proteiniborus ethanoligenes]|uniref:S-layer homology domain-containing protein n=1 Tax=Proteiniborus ethanoligenes TaxID=415015 RepID=A0A1H3LZD4_9FIRM|nr:S-layer homology domain-containing protein [Proteiniborus ethanoligenes]SDY69802.1 S-layer homology domain-containing protein [Proteiniborus ethanoligenes]
MKKILSLVIILALVFTAMPNYAILNNAGFEGGIHKNERNTQKTKEYKEMLFITGTPTLLQGTVEIKESEKKLTYNYKLSSKDGKISMTRNIDLERIIDDNTYHRQRVEVNNITKFKETITVNDEDGKKTYALTNYLLHNSTIGDNQPVATYYQGGWGGSKEYTINKTEGKVIEEITGDIYGYDHYWGGTETQKIHKDITFITEDENYKEIKQYGYVDIDVSFNRTKKMEYFDNLPYQTSFDGGYTLTEQDETVMKYSYTLPILSSNKAASNRKNIGSGIERFETLPTQQKLFIPKFEDIKGNWAEWDIKRLAGLQVIDGTQRYFGPNLNMKRTDFAKWIVLAMDLAGEEEQTSRRTSRTQEEKPNLFADISGEYPDYKYIKAVKEKEIMSGVGDNKFAPEGNLTRAEAITIVIRALGLERLAPNPPFRTRFIDDNQIPLWAKKAIYVADQVGIAKGSTDGYIHPNEPMTKAEAAAFINRFITYLQENMKIDHRENIINY